MSYHHGDLPNTLVSAARRLLRDGAAPVSIRAVAREVGVSANAPYRHFEDRDALLRAVAAAGYRDAARALAGGTGAPRVARVWRRLAEREPRLVALMTSTIGERVSADTDLAAAVGDWLGEVARAIEGGINGDDPAAVLTAAVACWASVHGLVALQSAGVLGVLDEWMLPDPGGMARKVTS